MIGVSTKQAMQVKLAAGAGFKSLPVLAVGNGDLPPTEGYARVLVWPVKHSVVDQRFADILAEQAAFPRRPLPSGFIDQISAEPVVRPAIGIGEPDTAPITDRLCGVFPGDTRRSERTLSGCLQGAGFRPGSRQTSISRIRMGQTSTGSPPSSTMTAFSASVAVSSVVWSVERSTAAIRNGRRAGKGRSLPRCLGNPFRSSPAAGQ